MKQRVVLPGSASSWAFIKAGVPQYLFRPSPFLIYINDIVDDIHSCIMVFADDTSLYIIVDNHISAAEELNADLAKIHAGTIRWLVSFNPAKYESMILSCKHNKPFQPQLSMNQNVTNNVNFHNVRTNILTGLLLARSFKTRESKSIASYKYNVQTKIPA